MPNRHTRRGFLRGALSLTGLAAASGLAGCDLLGTDGSVDVPPHELDGFLADTVALRDQYDAAIAAVPDLAKALAPVRDAHGQHADALANALGRAVPTTQGAPAAPANRAQAITTLAAAEKSARDEAVAACLASSGRLAPLLGSIAAARSTHLEVVK